jgi:hypothetical protein
VVLAVGKTAAVPPHARRLLSSLSVVVATVAVVVVLLVLPGRFAGGGIAGPDQPGNPTPTQQIDAVGSRDWAAVTCPGPGHACRVPTVLNLGGARFEHRRSHTRSVQQGDPATRTLVHVVSPAGGRRWVLVGADGAGPAAQLSIRIGSEAASIPPGTLTLVSVPGKKRSVQVTVSDYGTNGAHEVLRIEEYDALD